ncbi:MAG: phospholipid scramblase family protein [Actinomycetota bacterium]|nr:phospholipid scramblase family protein [Actinomycetota bacterium]
MVPSGSPRLLNEPTLVVRQKTKLFELRTEYGIFDAQGRRLGSVAQVRQSLLTVLTRVAGDLDVALPVTLEVRDADGAPVLVLRKPWFRRTMWVERPDGVQVGSIVKRVRMGRARFTLWDPTGIEVGEVRAENWRAKDFAVLGTHGREVARVAKQWGGLACEMVTDADHYVVRLEPSTMEPVRSLALSAALAIDLVMKQKDT